MQSRVTVVGNRTLALALAAAGLLASLPGAGADGTDENKTPHDFSKWEKAISAFEKSDAEKPPGKGGVLFIGSSSIRGWKLDQSFPGLGALNRGFGGSEIVDSTHFAPRIIFPYAPKTIVFYAGDNDIAGSKNAARVYADYQAFVKTVRAKLPQSRIVFIAIKPSISRWKLWPEMKQANAMIAAHTRNDTLLDYADIATPMLGKDGEPRKNLFVKDGLHLNAAGYKLWKEVLAPFLEK